jgi:hypothetical protein
MGTGDVSTRERVSFRAHVDRFPLAVKGALVLRAIDGIPHQVAFRRAVMAEMAGTTSLPLGLDQVVLDVGPTKDLFVPFEFAATDLASGWYQLECAVLVDGSPEDVRPGKPFGVPWPRGSTRRGTVDVGKAVAAGHGKVRIERVECGSDRIQVVYESSDRASMKLSAGGRNLAILDDEHDGDAGWGTLTAYPLTRTEDRLSIEIKGAADPLIVRLP